MKASVMYEILGRLSDVQELLSMYGRLTDDTHIKNGDLKRSTDIAREWLNEAKKLVDEFVDHRKYISADELKEICNK